MNSFVLILAIVPFVTWVPFVQSESPSEFLLLTVATNETEGYKRFISSVKYYNNPIKVLGRGVAWEGGDMSRPGGGQKVNLLRKQLKQLIADDTDGELIVMFTDAYDVIIADNAKRIVSKFKELSCRILFSAEVYCWPDKGLAPKYPKSDTPYRFLNSGGLIGYAKDLHELISAHPIKNTNDDQLYYTKLFLDAELRRKYQMKLDTRAEIFQNLHGAENDVELEVGSLEEGKMRESVVLNKVTNTHPSVLHGNGFSKLLLNSFGNYLAGAFPTKHSSGPPLSRLLVNEKLFPVVVMGIYVVQATPFFTKFLDKVLNLDYPKNRIHLIIYNSVEYHNKELETFLSSHGEAYLGVKEIKSNEQLREAQARNIALEYCLLKKCDYYFSLDSLAHLDNPETLKILISDDKSVVAAMLTRPYKVWSNFWGALSTDGFYARSFDYMDIVNYDKVGTWNVPYISSCYLVNATVLERLKGAYLHTTHDPDMSFCSTLRDKEVWMYVENRVLFGHLVDGENFNTKLIHPEFYELLNNQYDWAREYIHPEYSDSFNPDIKPLQPCPDVYWFPIVTDRFCDELVNIMESFGKWSSGNNLDERLTGGYENVPTRDIHMNQVGLDPLWLEFLHLYVRPLQEHVFTGYFHDPPKSLMNFVVRYRPDEQPSLRAHHDSSTYTINIALNKAGVDFQGGGCRFVRYNCSVVDTKKGWMLMHPGRLTHFHEGLVVTSGTRYIMISFVDP